MGWGGGGGGGGSWLHCCRGCLREPKKKDKTVIKNVTVSAKGAMAYESVSP